MSPIAVATLAAPSLNEAGDKASGRRLQSGHAFANRAALKVAADAWCANPTAAAATYGAIGTWDTSRITDLSYVFCGDSGGDCACRSFNDDISGWDVSNVVSMEVRATSAPAMPLASPPSPRASERAACALALVPSAGHLPPCGSLQPAPQQLEYSECYGHEGTRHLRSRTTPRLATLASCL